MNDDTSKLNILENDVLFEFKALENSILINDLASKYDPKDPLRDKLLSCSFESLLVHVRVLYDFFTSKNKGKYPNEIFAINYISSWTELAKRELDELNTVWNITLYDGFSDDAQREPKYSYTISNYIDKRLMHLTTNREQFPWLHLRDPIELLRKLIIVFLKNLPSEYSTEKTKKALVFDP